jgi:hypothetical protein
MSKLDMEHYRVILDKRVFDDFLASLPPLEPTEVWYACLFGRHKYDNTFPGTKDSNQLARFIAKNANELLEKVTRLECPIGGFSRDGIIATQDCLALYLAMNPRSLVRANRNMLVELAKRIAEGQLNFSPITVATTEIHRAVGRKFYVDFDFDEVDLADYLPRIQEILPEPGMYRILRTRGGFHLLVELAKIRGLRVQWHPQLAQLRGCDIKGSHALTPVPGCTQGGFMPYFV